MHKIQANPSRKMKNFANGLAKVLFGGFLAVFISMALAGFFRHHPDVNNILVGGAFKGNYYLESNVIMFLFTSFMYCFTCLFISIMDIMKKDKKAVFLSDNWKPVPGTVYSANNDFRNEA
jgi:quinol-cytochrome oxidoreductase complex cytochrome b subunit